MDDAEITLNLHGLMPENTTIPEDSDVWRFRAKVLNVVDGDTLDVRLDQGLRSESKQRIRLFGIDTAETYFTDTDSAEYRAGVKQHGFVQRWIDTSRRASGSEWPFHVMTLKETGKYGRWIGVLVDERGEGLGKALIEEFGSSVQYDD